jgi:DDE superfamily endonuclease
MELIVESGCTLAVTDNGWSNDSMAMNYIKHFNDSSHSTEPIGDYRLLILDGHGSHATFQFKKFYHDNRIILLYLPAHTTHKLQPLDIIIFGPQAEFYSQEVDQYSRYNGDGVTQREYLDWIIKARAKANTESNILSAWEKSGLIPFNPNIVLDKLGKPKKYTPLMMNHHRLHLFRSQLGLNLDVRNDL